MQLQCTKSTTYQGITTQLDRKWNSHVENIIGQATHAPGHLKQNLQVGVAKMKEKAYMSVVHWQHEMVQSSLGSAHKDDQAHRVEMVHRCAALYVCWWYRNTSSVSSMLDELDWILLEKCYQHALLTMIYRVVNGIVALPKKPTISKK